jgi:hypothetical protein
MKALLALSLSLLTFAAAAHADFHDGDGRDHDRDGDHDRPTISCAQIDANAANASQQLAQANVMLMNNAQLCPGGWNSNAACMMMIANAVNQATVANQNAQAQLQQLNDARAAVNNAQATVNIATANLMNLSNLCGGNNVGCILAYQNAYNQALDGQRRAQEYLNHVCF